MTDILIGTPPELTYLHPLVREAWMVVWTVTSGVLVLILGWMGLSLVMQHHLGQTQVGWREMVPRLLLGLVAAASSLWGCALVIDGTDAVSGFIAASLNVTAGALLRSTLTTLLTAAEAGGAAHRPSSGLRVPARVRGDSGLRAGAGPDLEDAHVVGLRLRGNPRALDTGQLRDL